MISILKNPYPCSFSKNPIDFRVQSNMYLKSVKACPSLRLKVSLLPNVSDHYRIEWINPENGDPQEVYFVVGDDNVVDSIVDLPSSFGGTTDQYKELLIEKLRNYAPLNGWFTIEDAGLNILDIIAKEPLEELAPTFHYFQTTFAISGTPNTVIIDPEIRDGYQMYAQVYLEKELYSGNFEMVSEQPCVLDNSGICDIDVKSILDKEIEQGWSEYPMPQYASTEVSKALRRYYVQFTESWNDDPVQYDTISDILFVHWGGVSFEAQSTGDPLHLNATASHRMLTWWPSGKKLTKSQVDWISWMNPLPEKSIKIQLTVYTTGGVITATIGTLNLKQWETVTCRSGYPQLQLNLAPDPVIKWSIQIFEGTTPLSEEYMYYLDNSNCLCETIMYFNSFGVPETFNTSGDWIETMNVSTQIASRSEYFNNSGMLPQSFVYDSSHFNSFETVTGILSNKEAKRLQPLLNSMISFLVRDKKYIPIIVNTDSVPLIKKSEFIQRIKLNLLRANENDRASFFEPSPTFTINVNCGINSVNIDSNGINLSSYGPLFIKNSAGTIVSISSWNSGLGAYEILTPITADGNYTFEATIDTYKVIKHFNYRTPKAKLASSQSGMVSISLKGSASQSVYIDWGDGYGYQVEGYGTTLTPITHDYASISGLKHIQLSKGCFDDILELNITGWSVQSEDFSNFKNLQKTTLISAVEGVVYFSQFDTLTHIYVQNSNVSALKIGFQKQLTLLSISNLSINTNELDVLFLELWEYRKFYINNPSLYIQALGYTESSLVTAIINGTGNYANEGLATDYGWTILIF